MLNFVWKYKFILYILIFIFFINSLISILNPKIFFETERILKYADDIQIELKESFNDKNLLLLGLEFEEEISFEKMKSLDSSYQHIKNDSLIKLERSLFSEKRMIFSGLFFHSFNVLNLASKQDFLESIKRIKEKSAFFLSDDQKKMFFILEMKENLESSTQENLINKLKSNFSDQNPKKFMFLDKFQVSCICRKMLLKSYFI